MSDTYKLDNDTTIPNGILAGGFLNSDEGVVGRRYRVPIRTSHFPVNRYRIEALNVSPQRQLKNNTALMARNNTALLAPVVADKDVEIVLSFASEKYGKAEKRIIELCLNQEDEYSLNENVRKMALAALNLLWRSEVAPSLINPSGDESLLFEFFVEEDFYLIEFYNSGEIVYLRKTTGQPKVIKEIGFQELEEATKEIARAYNNANV